MRVETFADQLFFTTVRIEAECPSGSWVGTGFVYAVETNKGTAHFVVTNKHVLEAAETVTVRMIQQDAAGGPRLGQATQITIQDFGATAWSGHPDPSVDVAVMPAAAVLEAMASSGAAPFFRSVPPEVLLTEETAIELDAVEEINFIGYPNGLYDTANYLPILRTGTTATPISVDYQGKPAFLVDASVFPGSSGSPVCIANRGTYLSRGGGVVVGSRVICLGVLAAVHVRAVQGTVDVLPSKLVSGFDEPIDLGIVFKASCIDECVSQILALAGLVAVASSPSTPSPMAPSVADEAITNVGTGTEGATSSSG